MPESLWRLVEHPFLPIVVRQVAHDGSGYRAVVVSQKGTPPIVFEILIGNTVPIRRATNAQFLAEPFHVATVILGVLPKVARRNVEQPILPVVVGEMLLNRINGRAIPVSCKKATTRVAFEIIGGYSIPVFPLAETEFLPQPSDVETAILYTMPVSVWNPPI